MELGGLSLFVDTVREGSITGAARKRGMPKSTLSRRLKRFEAELGVRLLERSTRRLDLTEAGATLYESAAPFLEELYDIQASIRAWQRQPKGRLTIRVPEELFPAEMSELIGEFLQRYPEISLSCTPSGGIPSTASGEFDLQFVLHDAPLPSSDWIARALMSIPQGLFIAPHAMSQAPVSLDDLSRRSCLRNPGESQWMFRRQGRVEAVAVGGRLELGSADMQLNAAIRGQGIARIARYQAEGAVRRGALTEVSLEGVPLARELTVIYRSRHLPLRTRLFLEHFQGYVGRLRSLL